MIIREYDSYCLIITQPAHAWISGQIACQWGANGFKKTELWEDMCQAAYHHDAGWLDWEAHPMLNIQTGRPYSFMNLPIGDHLQIWKKTPEYIGLVSRYAQLLVSRHVMGLCNRHDFSKDSETIKKSVSKFRDDQKILQNELLEKLYSDPFYKGKLNHTLKQHQKLISLFDYLSLIICMGSIKEEIITNVPNEKGPANLHVIKSGYDDNAYKVNPWPFIRKEIEVHCDGVKLMSKHTNQASLQREMKSAERITYVAKVIPF
ncbi:MAG: DUF3891 family protein [Balneolales bacterium]